LGLKLLVDECIADKQLIKRLRDAGHDAKSAYDLGLDGKSDLKVFECAIVQERVVLTFNI
jgi:predicted nuclease of predicted toxin-antitoxin system